MPSTDSFNDSHTTSENLTVLPIAAHFFTRIQLVLASLGILLLFNA